MLVRWATPLPAFGASIARPLQGTLARERVAGIAHPTCGSYGAP